ncbi:MAG: hypothetical protein KKB66_18490 [Alphaproteobacteria bacterium]|uniref:Uncharacterized protein n=2 Tax=viral metagenome TaxID=1070528 RepID=A0A6H1ZHK6_9ZZZZ|nr:hypothetical protein [Alphaproteobacteria bacterium]MBU0803593.1 hypothetical protein [Alphaproteobacteria bacterium]MBU0873110.1 hypothetical protein [Alphaproteobacteria bacterium]MBU1402520.1 hypothetical protein [Alphaproteobacteria bacterium]MBU1593162.1 hypothetical protein [Alphaproteobacteria bacterium]
MFNRSEIMKVAWAVCRTHYTFNGRFIFRREHFAKALKQAWASAKLASGALPAAEVAKIERASVIRDQIDALKYKSSRMNVEPTRQRLERELMFLA